MYKKNKCKLECIYTWLHAYLKFKKHVAYQYIANHAYKYDQIHANTVTMYACMESLVELWEIAMSLDFNKRNVVKKLCQDMIT